MKNETADNNETAFTRLYAIAARLRSPQGCPWDREQTPLSLREDLIEETYECVEAITEGSAAHIKEELGDIFLLAVMLSYMYEQAGAFSVAEVLHEVCEKLIRRHPHVFGDTHVKDSAEVLDNWAKIKVEKEGRPPKDSLLDEAPRSAPPLERAYKLQKKAAEAGFDWLSLKEVMGKLEEEVLETKEAARLCQTAKEAGEDARLAPAQKALEEELGDILFSAVNVCRFLGFNPSAALQKANSKFTGRFKYVEKRMKETGHAMRQENLEIMDRFWEETKQAGRS
ncbi:MAG: nucleoside triphosphate pyrophosphohydrolase [Spirochaetaceae bacterium]|jgi:tetrapyrrole methylase family protein/MazG family protein|nr:nucleoside triphosphate pyrophosphohydrolase [Spirochaetaceae bacterium]